VLEICFQLLLLHAKSDATSRRLNRAETVQSALVASRKQAEARSGPNYLPMTSRHAALVELVSAQFAGDEKARYAFMCVPRRLFAPEPLPAGITENSVYENTPIKSGFWHQSQPTVYAEALRLMRIDDELGLFSFLCIGSGSGYFNSLVAVMQNWQGVNCGIELRSEMAALSRTRIAAFCRQVGVLNNIDIRHGNTFMSLHAQGGKFDRIYVASAVDESSAAQLCSLLSNGGIMLAPVAIPGAKYQHLCVYTKSVDGTKLTRAKGMEVNYAVAIPAVPRHPHALAGVAPDRLGPWSCGGCSVNFNTANRNVTSAGYLCTKGCKIVLCADCAQIAVAPMIQWR
jgi:protein-L-isoaspartate O-methyltransferase